MVTKPAKYTIRKISVLDTMAQAAQPPALWEPDVRGERKRIMAQKPYQQLTPKMHNTCRGQEVTGSP